MKNIYNFMVLLVGLCCLSSCEDDNDSNPTLKEPASFVLNTPKYVSGIYDLKNTESVLLTCTQPDYGFTAPTVYNVQVATKSDFSEFTSLATSYTAAKLDVSSAEIAVALVGLLGIEEEENYPTNEFSVYVRLSAKLTNGMGVALSNIIELPKVKGYFALDAMTMPENIYIIGNVAGNWNWSKSTSMVSVFGAPGKFWAIQYLGKTETGDNASIKFNSVKDWNTGEPFGIKNSTIDAASIALASVTGDDNITIGNPGWYIVVVTVTIEGRSYKYTVEFLQPNVYLTGNPSGGFDVYDNARLFTVPTTADGDFVSPACVAAGELRLCVKLADTNWWATEFIVLAEKIEYRGNGGDQDRVSVAAGQKVTLNFATGTGKVQ